jgi:hypothetical protein
VSLLRNAQIIALLLTIVKRAGQVFFEKQGGQCVRELSWYTPEPCASFAIESIPEAEGFLTRFARRRESTDLLQSAQSVFVNPVLHDLSIYDPIKGIVH